MAITNQVSYIDGIVTYTGSNYDSFAPIRGFWYQTNNGGWQAATNATNTGWLIEYDPAIDEITTPYRMYVADGMQTTGAAHKVDMQPGMIENYI